MKNYDLTKDLGVQSPTNLYLHLKKISKEINNNGEIFKKLIIQSTIDPRLIDDDEDYNYASAYREAVENLYPNLFGIDRTRLWEEQVLEGGEYTMEEFFNMCYVYITSYLTSEREFLDEFIMRVTERDAKLIKRLEANRKEIEKITSEHMEKIVESYNEIKKEVTLESAKPEEYPNTTIECIVLDNIDKIKSYITYLPKGIIANNNSEYDARPGEPGEVIDTSTRGFYNDKEYIFNRNSIIINDYSENEIENAQVVVAREDKMFVLSPKDFSKQYELEQDTGKFISVSEPKEYIKVDSNIIINGIIILKDSYISLNENYEIVDIVDSKTFENNYSVNKEKNL